MKKKELLQRYGELLAEIDGWFTNAAQMAGPAVRCSSGCSDCCRGLFDITLLDAWYLRRGFIGLPEEVKEQVIIRAMRQRDEVVALWPGFQPPYLLNERPETDWEPLMPEDDPTPCPLLDQNGWCLVYDHRPMTCRLHGLPLMDVSGEPFHDGWCSHNFIGQDPTTDVRLHWEFYRHFSKELTLFQEFSTALFKQSFNELDTLIPLALLVEYETFDWQKWFATVGLQLAAEQNSAAEETHQ